MTRKLLALLLAFSTIAANAADVTAEKLPVRRVVLYKNGIGYFEHTGRVVGNQDLKIDFTSAQLNDVLKSLTVVDLNGGRISGVGYNSVAPIDEQLKSLRLPLGQAASLSNFLNALRGSRVQVRNGAALTSGRLLSVEEKTVRKEKGETVRSLELSVVTDSGEVRTFAVTPTLGVRVADRDLTSEITKYMNLVSSTRDQDLRQMTIATTGSGARNVFVSYISEVPVWKSTYRILLPTKAGDRPVLQGWAIVDNTVGEDWNNVELSLVAGAPQSFIQELSRPLYTRRPVVALPQAAMLTPQTHEGTQYDRLETYAKLAPAPATSIGYGSGVGAGSGKAMVSGRFDLNGSFTGVMGHITDPMGAVIANAHIMATNSRGESRTAYSDSDGNFHLELAPEQYKIVIESPGFKASVQNIAVVPGRPSTISTTLAVGAATETVEITSAQIESSVEPEANGAELGDLFEYRLKEKVTILKNHSALVPIINSHIDAEKVTLWSSSSPRSLRAIWITNTSGLTLDGGTFNVMEENAFSGEGLIDPLKPAERRLLSYAVDQAVRVKYDSDENTLPVTHLKIAKGVMTETREQRDHGTYTIRNSDTQPRDVIIEHPLREGWKLSSEAKPEETSASYYRFRVKVPANKTAELKLDEVEPLESTVALSSITDDQIKLLFTEKVIKPEVEQVLRKIIAKKNEIAALDQQIQTRESQIKDINQDQQRLRENMKALKGSEEEKALLQRYTRQLNDQEDRLDAVRAEIAKLQLARTEKRQQLDTMLQEMTLDENV